MTLPVRRIVAALTLGAALVTGGCGSTQADRAATVDGEVITEAEVQQVVTEINGMEPALLQEAFTPTTALTALVRAPVAIDFFADKGVVTSESVARTEAGKRGVKEPSEGTISVIRFVGVLSRANQSQQFTAEDETELLARMADRSIEVNPRYGTFDPEIAAINAEFPEWVAPYTPDQ